MALAIGCHTDVTYARECGALDAGGWVGWAVRGFASGGTTEQGGFSVGTPVKIWSLTAGTWEEGVIISAKDDVVTASYRT